MPGPDDRATAGSRGLGPVTRRRFVRDAGVAAIAATDLLTAPAAARQRQRRTRRPTVAVFGGGIAGLTVAHELAERGFDVTVYERRGWGGKARSTWVPGSASGGRKPLPGEHGFRFEFGFYRNLPDTLRRIPFGSNRDGVFDNLVATPDLLFARDRGRRDFLLPTHPQDPTSLSPDRILDMLTTVFANPDFPPQATAFFVRRLLVFFFSCDRRRREQWERTPWSEFIAVDRYPEDYRKIWGELPRIAQAANARRASTDWMGAALEAGVYCITGRADGPALRLLNGPTNETWIEPWLAELQRLGVRLRLHHTLRRLELRRGRIAAAAVDAAHRSHRVEADWFVCALPVERAQRLWSRRMLAAEPRLRQMQSLETDWMNGLKLFLRENRPLARGGVIYADGPWAVTSVNQAQFWPCGLRPHVRGWPRSRQPLGDHRQLVGSRRHLRQAGEGVHAPGTRARGLGVHQAWRQQARPAAEADRRPPCLVGHRSWHEIPQRPVAERRPAHGADRRLATRSTRRRNRDPEPGARRRLPRLDALVGTMEAANEAGRRAANVVLEKTGSADAPARVYTPFHPPEWEPLKRIDADRYRHGQPNMFDADLTSTQLRDMLARHAST